MVDILRNTAGGGDSEVRRLMREHDWSTSPLGPPESWPPELATAVSMVVSSTFPMFVAWGPELRFLYNDAYAVILGDKHPAAFGGRFQVIWHEIWPDIVPIIDRALSNKSVFLEDLPLTLDRKGYFEQAWFTFSYSPLHDGQGTVQGMYCTVIETTARVLSERSAAFELLVADTLRPLTSSGDVIQTATALLGAELGLTRTIYAEVDDPRNIFCVRRDWQRGGLPSLAGRTFAIDAFGPDIGAAGRAGEVIAVVDVSQDPRTGAVQGAYAAMDVAAVLLVPLVRGGQLLAFLGLGMARPHHWSEAEIGLARGMAGRIWSAVDLARTQAALREADRRKDEFLAMLAHELRNPLAPISAAADLLKIGRLDESRVRQSSAIIARQVRHMTSLVDDLLDVSRVTRGLVTLARAPVSARTIVDEAIEQVRPMFDARRQRLVVRILDPEATVLGDKARLVQVLSNLLNNASKYTLEERGIEVEATGNDGRLVLTVRDQGIGMEPGLSPHVFDLFTQAKRSSDRSQGGLGLGLALVKHLVELHGGSVACESTGLGQGSSFMVSLPLMLPLAGQPDAAGMPLPGQQPRALRLLVVDDNVDAAATLGMLLEACGHEVAIEHDSLRALERAGSIRPDAALLDIGLPEMDGNELARRLRADVQTAAVVLIAVTGYGQEQDRRTAFEAGFDHHLVKPVDMDRLAGLLAGVLEKRGA